MPSYWDWVASDSTRIEENVYGDLNIDDCLLAIESGLDLDKANWVLELGCGVGRLIRPLALKYPHTTFAGVDSSPLMLDNARMLDPSIGWVLNNGSDLCGLPSRFDAAYTMTTFQHLAPETQQGYLAELRRVLKPQGKLKLQFVTEGETGEMSYPTPVKTMLEWCDAAGLKELKVEVGVIKPEWCWLTLVKR
jgi:cyclopropane fatty-acyl-phospholipid synthase-like methyltransferase